MLQRARSSAGLALGMLALFISLSQFAVGQGGQQRQQRMELQEKRIAEVLRQRLASGDYQKLLAAQLKNQLSSIHLKQGAVKTKDIANGAVKGIDIRDGAVQSQELAPMSVQTDHLGPASVTSQILQANAVTAAKLAPLSVVSGSLADDAVKAGKLAPDAVTASKLAPEAVTAATIAPDAVTAAKIAADAVTESKLAPKAVNTDAIATNAITSSLIATSAITSNLIAPNAINSTLLAPNSVGDVQIQNNSITSFDLQNGAVGTPALAKVPSVALTRTNDMTFADPTGFSVVNVDFDVERWDTAGMFDPADPETVTIPEDGIYQVTANIEWSGTPANVIGGRVLSVLDGVTDLVFSSDAIDTSGAQVGVPAQGVSKQLELNAGDELVLGISQVLSPAGSADVVANPRSPTFEVTWVAPPTS